MDLTFLTPTAAVFSLSALLPLGIAWGRGRRMAHIRHGLDLPDPGWRARAPVLASLVAIPLLLAVAAAQPVIGTTRSVPERTDAEAFFVIDTSRSMLASSGPNGKERFERAREAALALRSRIPQVPAGLVTMTDRLLPNTFPTTDGRVFDATLEKSIDIERPPPEFTYNTQATSYDVLAGIPERNYFSPTAKKRVLVVLTDGESRDFGSGLARAFEVDPPIETIFVRFWNKGERIYAAGVPEGPYHPLPRSEESLRKAAELTGGRMYDESDLSAAGNRIVEIVGKGETGSRQIAGARLALMPWVVLIVFVPLAFLLWRRNLVT
jgi:hypothetical protein